MWTLNSRDTESVYPTPSLMAHAQDMPIIISLTVGTVAMIGFVLAHGLSSVSASNTKCDFCFGGGMQPPFPAISLRAGQHIHLCHIEYVHCVNFLKSTYLAPRVSNKALWSSTWYNYFKPPLRVFEAGLRIFFWTQWLNEVQNQTMFG